MYQKAGSKVRTVPVEECLGVPCILHTLRGQSVNTSLVYCQDDDATSTWIDIQYGALNGAAQKPLAKSNRLATSADQLQRSSMMYLLAYLVTEHSVQVMSPFYFPGIP
jgi:hypothetical protein